MPVLGDVTLQAGDRGPDRHWRDRSKIRQAGDLLGQRSEERVGSHSRNDLRAPQRDQTVGAGARFPDGDPRRSVAPRLTALEGRPERRIPVPRPAAHDQPELVEDPVEIRVHARIVGRQLRFRVLDAIIEVVAMKLHNQAALVSNRRRSFHGVRIRDDDRLNAFVAQRALEQPVEVGSEDDTDKAAGDKTSDGPMR